MFISINAITKSFKLFKRKAGLKESIKSFFNRKYEYFTALDNINLNIEQNDYVKILVYNVNGQLVQTVYNGFISGNQLYNFTWDASNFSSGIYIVNIDSEHLTQSKIVNLLK